MEIVDMASIDHPEHYQGTFECIDEMVALLGENPAACERRGRKARRNDDGRENPVQPLPVCAAVRRRWKAVHVLPGGRRKLRQKWRDHECKRILRRRRSSAG